MPRTPIYCGNNRRDPRAKNAGTPRECFQKGFGGGYNSPVDNTFKGPYAPLMENKLYCGSRPPRGKVRATLSQCAQMGWGVGAKKKALEEGGAKKKSRLRGGSVSLYSRKTVVFGIVLVIEFVILYYARPHLVTRLSKKGVRVIDWAKFAIMYVLIALLSTIIMVIN